jgi:hypothetical protein
MSDFEIAKINKLIDLMKWAHDWNDVDAGLHEVARIIVKDWNPKVIEASPRALQDAFVVRD